MVELLHDNMEMERRQPSDAQGIDRQGRREVPDILNWITCFGMYASILCDNIHWHLVLFLCYYYIIILVVTHLGHQSSNLGWRVVLTE